ncbi:MAG TPA: uracil-DNA glycosylase [Thermodesulfobacteriota bacterium]|nr:uracil-DNA glycosylase [Thermodesulfobacteriota bacterium]
MNLQSELKEILDELRRCFEFQRILGLESVVLSYPREEEKPKAPMKQPTRIHDDKEKSVIKIEEQLSIFDRSAKKLTLEEIREEIGDCTRCKLHQGRTNIVFGEGNPKARLVFVGEGPGEEEDKQARPFVGRAGQLLTKIIAAMGFKRSDVYICNVVKCRPPGNRTPEPDETGTCEQFLFKQLRAINPEVIVCLGSVAAQSVLKTKEKLGNLRGKFHSYGRSKVMVTYHPAALLRNPGFKKPLWEDMQVVMKEMGVSKGVDVSKSREQF